MSCMDHSADNSRQQWQSDSYQENTGFVSVYGEDVLGWLDAKPDERILDLGCGDGILTRKIAEQGVDVIGVDASKNFVDTACNAGLDVRLMDGHELTFNNEFDAVFSNAALHWMLQPTKVIAGVRKALKPGGRFVGEFGGFGNVAAVSTAMRAVGVAMGGNADLAGPWFYPTVSQYSAMLETAGFHIDNITTFARPTPLPTGIRGWLEVMRKPFFDQFEDRAQEAYDKVEDALRPSLCDHEGHWIADYVRLRFSAHLVG